MQHESDDEAQEGWRAWLWIIVCCTVMIAVIAVLGLAYWGSR
ncbi:hypothetical protein [Hyphomicrobium sp.]|nr:hypothetical protein [Hyphomicrobium sp.]